MAERHVVDVRGDGRPPMRVVVQEREGSVLLVGVAVGLHTRPCMLARIGEACDQAGGLARELWQELGVSG